MTRRFLREIIPNNNKRNQELFQNFRAQVKMKMTGDKDCVSTDAERIIYVTSRVGGPALKNIQPWVTSVVEGRADGFKTWEEILDVLRRVYDVTDRRAERDMAALQQRNIPFVQFLAKFNVPLAGLSWDDPAKVSALKTRIGMMN
jgi:Retrotransposon gag protein